MSFGAFYSGLTSLGNEVQRLGVIGNNLANINTVGFKSSRATFQDLISQSRGTHAVGLNQIGSGSQISAVTQIFNQGSMQGTGVVTDVAIQGSGFFILRGQDGQELYTRAGDFLFDDTGALINTSGFQVQGFTSKDADGNINSATGINPIQLSSRLLSPPAATTEFSTSLNLSAETEVSQTTPNDPFSTSLVIYDSFGVSRELTLTFTPVDNDPPADNSPGTVDAWDYELSVPDDETATGNGTLASGRIVFDSDGQVDLAQVTADVPLDANGTLTFSTPVWSNGAASQTISWPLFDEEGSLLTQYASESAPSRVTQDGFGAGTLNSLTINQQGVVEGLFTNGQTEQLAQLALALFINNNGLASEGQSTYSATQSAGTPAIGSPGTGGRGVVFSNSLELSNVDITEEFTDLIVSQRGYQANSRTITTVDQVLQEALQIKR